MTSFRQVPQHGEVFLDHIAHWIPGMDAAVNAMRRLGFTLTPYPEHTKSTAPGEPIVPAGSANHCIMLREGYPKISTRTAAMARGKELRGGIGRCVGRSRRKVERGWLISFERGGVALLSREKLQNQVSELEILAILFIAGYVLQCRDLAVFAALLSSNGIVYRELTRNVVAVDCPSVLGGTLKFTGGAGATPWGL